MKLSSTINYLNELIDSNDVLVAGLINSRRIWYFLNFILRYPSLLMVAGIGILSSITVKDMDSSLSIAILVLTSIVAVLNTTHMFLQPDVQIEGSTNTIHMLESLNSELRMSCNELAIKSDNQRHEIDMEDRHKYLLIVTKFELSKSNIMKSMPSRLFMRQGVTRTRKKSAFDVTPETTSDEVSV